MKVRIGFLGSTSEGRLPGHALPLGLANRAEAVAFPKYDEINPSHTGETAPEVQHFQEALRLKQSAVDAVYISTSNFTHVPLALEALKAGKHLLLEVPGGITQTECRLLEKVAARSDQVVMLAHRLRYAPLFQKMHALIEAGEISRPRMVWAKDFQGESSAEQEGGKAETRRSGGLLVRRSTHHFDLLNWWAGARPARVSAFGGALHSRASAAEHRLHDHATVSFDYDNGTLGTLQICYFGRGVSAGELEMGVIGETGSLVARTSTMEVLHWKMGAKEARPIAHRIGNPSAEGGSSLAGYNEMMAAFVDAVLNRTQPLASLGNCLDGTLLAIAADESIQHGHSLEI